LMFSRVRKTIDLTLLLVLAFPAICASIDQISNVDSISTDKKPGSSSLSNLRGIEREEKYADEFWRKPVNVLLFFPRNTTGGFLYFTGRGAYHATNPELIAKIEKFLYFYDRRLGWHPLLMLDSDLLPEAGAKGFYRSKRFSSSLRGTYTNSEKWKGNSEFQWLNNSGIIHWDAVLSAQISKRDRKFYGIGKNPLSDPRSNFDPNTVEEMGIFVQRRERIQFKIRIHNNRLWEYLLKSYFQNRELLNSELDGLPFDNIFDSNTLPGGKLYQSRETYYSEIALRLNKMNLKLLQSSWINLEFYSGYLGSVENDGELLRAGTEFSISTPVLKQNRIVTTHMALNIIENLNDKIPVPFTEYPLHPCFRGVSEHSILRTDNISLVPTVEYNWKLTHNIGGFLFTDFLLVSETINNLSVENAPWAAGIGIQLSSQGHVFLAYGSEGIRASLSIGADFGKNDRLEWD